MFSRENVPFEDVTMTVYTGPEKRRHFRLHYPTTDRPKFHIDEDTFDVVELSEGGVVFSSKELGKFILRQPVFGVLHLPDKQMIAVAGKVQRLRRSEVVVQLTKCVPTGVMMSEQRYVIARYLHK